MSAHEKYTINNSGCDINIAPILHALQAGLPVALPTETVYGLAARADDPDAIARIFALKERPVDKILPICVTSAAMAARLVRLNSRANALIADFWPGPLTVIAKARPYNGLHISAIAPDGSIGLRLPDSPWVAALDAAGWNTPLVLTSANKSGGANPVSAQDVRSSFGAQTPPMIDTGPCAAARPSTIIDTRAQPMPVLREGALPAERLGAYALAWKK